MDVGLSRRVERLDREVRRLRLALLALGLVTVGAVTIAAVRTPEVLRAKGLVIVDAQGRDRILLGAPVPASSDRKRRDAATASLVILGPDGADRVIVGQTPPPMMQGRVYRRSEEGWGLVLHDPHGSERGGMGVLGDARAAVALDYPTGDAVGMFVDDRTDRAVIALNHSPKLKPQDSAVEITAADGASSIVLHDAKGRVLSKSP